VIGFGAHRSPPAARDAELRRLQGAALTGDREPAARSAKPRSGVAQRIGVRGCVRRDRHVLAASRRCARCGRP
jgi:hypothetical protein